MSNPTFGISTETKSKNATPFDGGFGKALLKDVKKEEIGKDTKYTVLTFSFIDLEGIKSYKHSEFIPQQTDENYEKKFNGLNSRIKHLFEAYAPFPTTGIGMGAVSWDDFFDKVALAFNTGNNGQPIYKKVEGEKAALIAVWLKLIYQKSGNLSFPLSPNFIEKIEASNQTTPKTLSIDKRYDNIVQPDVQKKSGDNGGIMGGSAVDDNAF